ncbi:MAG: oligosaccharide flippase family protein [Nanoarchaeota archaeon]
MINLKNKLVRGSLMLLFLVGIFNILNFLYHLIMARIMPIEDFGMLKRVFAFLYIGAIFMESVQTVVVKYASNYKQNNGKLKSIFLRVNKEIIPTAIVVAVIFLILSIFLSPLFNIAYSLLFATSIFIIFSIFVPIARGILQGQQRFLALGLSMLGEAFLKIGVSFFLVYIGLGVLGAVWGVVISLVLSLGISLIFINKVLSSKTENAPLEGIRSYSKPVFLITSALILFINIDILIAGNIFSDFDAGVYAIASTIALIIFIAVQPINKVLFPITAVDSANNKPSRNNFVRAMILVSIICFGALIIIIFFTEQIIYLISGKMLPEAKIPAVLLSAGTTLLSLSSTILYYKLSLGRTRYYLWSMLFLLIEIVLLTLMSTSLINYSLGFLISNAIFFIGSLILLRK